MQSSYNPESFGWPAHPKIVPFTYYSAKGFLPISFPGGVADGTQDLWTQFLTELEPLIDGGFMPGTCWGFEARNIAGTNTRSFHSYGLAVDVNAPYNGRGGNGGHGRFQIPRTAIAVANKYGIESGLQWDYTDPMHFEIHLSPTEVAGNSISSFTGSNGGTDTGSSSLLSNISPLLLIGVLVIIGVVIVATQT